MAGASSFADAALVAGSKIGRYFGLVSAVPSALFVLFVYALASSGAWTGEPQPSSVAQAVGDVGFGEASLLLLLGLALGLLLHPLQFALIQVLEGYWGTSLVGRRLAVARIHHHRARSDAIDRLTGRSAETLAAIAKYDKENRPRQTLESELGIAYVPALVDSEAYRRASAAYPEDYARVMPTRLGNVLRRFEDDAGRQYGLDAVTIGPHLALLADPRRAAYLSDARDQLDLSVRLCALALSAAVVAFAFLVTDGLWLLVVTVPYGLAYIFYRGAIVAATNYMVALAVVIDLDRWALYSQLHLKMPATTADERIQNSTLIDLLSFKSTPVLSYAHPPDTSVEVTQMGVIARFLAHRRARR